MNFKFVRLIAQIFRPVYPNLLLFRPLVWIRILATVFAARDYSNPKKIKSHPPNSYYFNNYNNANHQWGRWKCPVDSCCRAESNAHWIGRPHEKSKKLLRPVLNLSKSLDLNGSVNAADAMMESPSEIMHDLATMFGQRRIYFRKKAAFLLWRDYTRKKVVKRLKKDLMEKERVSRKQIQ